MFKMDYFYKKILFIFLLLLIFFVHACTYRPPLAAEALYKIGLQEYQAGNYKKAYYDLFYAAQQSMPEAEYAVGYMHYYGLGTYRDIETSAFWIQNAVRHDYSKALHALHIMYGERPVLPFFADFCPYPDPGCLRCPLPPISPSTIVNQLVHQEIQQKCSAKKKVSKLPPPSAKDFIK